MRDMASMTTVDTLAAMHLWYTATDSLASYSSRIWAAMATLESNRDQLFHTRSASKSRKKKQVLPSDNPQPPQDETSSIFRYLELRFAMTSEPEDSSAYTEPDATASFESLGIIPELCTACKTLNYKYATPIQAAAIPEALAGRDIIGLAETGSGKTAAFALPILQALMISPSPLFACVLVPTRELAFQISDQFEALGVGIGIKVATITGGMDSMAQAIALSKKPHVVVASPGRLLDHLESTKGFSLRTMKYLVHIYLGNINGRFWTRRIVFWMLISELYWTNY
jgi:ATP-dependent helicase YprA (DUF1998 family)